MNRRTAAVIVFALASLAIGADPPPKPSPGRIERAPEFVRRVDDAIARGVEWLRTAQAPDGSFTESPGFPGATTALAYHTMRVCGVAREDPAAVRAWESLRRSYRAEGLRTYAAALFLMAIELHGTPMATPTDEREVRLTAEDAKWAREIARSLAGAQTDGGAWSYFVPFVPEELGYAGAKPAAAVPVPEIFDHSNTQYALLGLKCAARCGVAIDPSVWKKSLLHFLAEQEPTGPEVRRGAAGIPKKKGTTGAPVTDHARGWNYKGQFEGRSAYASMTAGGVSSVVICRSELSGTSVLTKKLDADSERSVWDGLAWLGTRWQVAGRTADSMHTLYEFYGVERAGMLAGVEWMSDCDWYGAGAPPILGGQKADGGWPGSAAAARVRALNPSELAFEPVSTCFALLFLKKGTAPVRRGAVTQIGSDADINFAEAAKLSGHDFEDFVDLVLSRWRRGADAGVKRRIFEGATSTGGRLVEPLLVRMDSSDVDERAAAHALLCHATGLDFGYVAGAAPDGRESAVVKWQSWWIGAKDRVVYDAAAKRLVVH